MEPWDKSMMKHEEKIISGQRFSAERALYAARGVRLEGCRFEGEEDGESALKESRLILAQDCFFDLRYPLWHAKDVRLFSCTMTENCRAALWYDEDVFLENCKLHGIKAVRECTNVRIDGGEVVSPEFGWHSRGISLRSTAVTSEYAFLGSRNIVAEGLQFSGKYSFQYTRNVRLERCALHTKDAFWHAKGATLIDCEVDGEYLGWYSEGLTLIRCRIRGTQPLCYCRRLRLIDCTMENADLALEYSDVRADVKGDILSVKNVRRGRVEADHIGEVLTTPDAVYPVRAKIVQRCAPRV